MYTVESVIFETTGKGRRVDLPDEWRLMHRGFLNSSVNLNATVRVYQIDTFHANSRKELASNHYKLKKWRDIVHRATHPVVLTDIDVCFLDDIGEGFTNYPITLTSRSHRWCNAGVVFVRPCEESRIFFDQWCRVDDWLQQGAKDRSGNPKRLKDAWGKTGVKGQNQTSLAMIAGDFDIGWTSGAVYNASTHKEWAGNPKVVHVKDPLRSDVVFSVHSGTLPKFPIARKIKIWYTDI